MIVVDASAILELLLRTDVGRKVEARILRPGETIHAPALIDLETAQVLRRYVTRGELTAARAKISIDTLVVFPMERYTQEPLIGRIWALRQNLTAYDAAYIALAEGLRAPLVTCDAKLANAPGTRAVVEVVT